MFLKKKKEQLPRYREFDSYWVQKVLFARIEDRVAYFKKICTDKRILHIGCTDWPIFDPKNNLHIHLSTVTDKLSGFDIDKEGLSNVSKFVKGKYYSDFSEITGETFDICLIPETIEHVDNIKTFLQNIGNINAAEFYITAPNCFSEENIKRNYFDKDQFIEVVHPDHNCWYSPFTLKNSIEKYSTLKVEQVMLLENDRMICCKAGK